MDLKEKIQTQEDSFLGPFKDVACGRKPVRNISH